MGVITSAGTRIYLGTTSGTATQVDYEADAYTEIGEIVQGPEFGREYQIIQHTPLTSRGVNKLKGSYNEGDPTLQLGRDLDDAGQQAVEAALAGDGSYNFKVEYNDLPDGAGVGSTPTVDYFKAKVASFKTNVQDANSIVGASMQLAIISGSRVTVDAVIV